MAFTATNVPTFPVQPEASRVQLTSTSLGTAFTAGSNGSKVTGVIVTSTDTSAQILTLFISNGGTNYELTAVSIPLGSGTVAGTAPVNLLSAANIPGLPTDNDGNSYINLISGDTLTAQLGAITAAKHFNVHVIGAHF